MKALLTSLLISTFALVGCGTKENGVSLKVSAGMTIGSAGFTGGLVVSGKNSNGQRFVKSVFGGDSIKVTLPDGSWDVSIVGWDGPTPNATQAPFSGTPYCGKTTLSLSHSDTSVNVDATTVNCAGDDFTGTSFYDGGSSAIYPLKIVTCGSFYDHSPTSFTKITSANYAGIQTDYCSKTDHPVDLRPRTKSIKLIPLNKNLNGVYEPMFNANPYCVTASTAGVFNIPQQIPVNNLPLMMLHFRDATCGDKEDGVIFPDGIKNGLPDKFDSILVNKTSDPILPANSNRLLLSDNGIKKGWSPLYDLMPNVKCSSGFCGDLYVGTSSAKYTDGVFDHFVDLIYQPSLNSYQTINFEAPTDICTSLTVPSTVGGNTNQLQIGTCTYSNGRINLQVKSTVDATNCASDLSDLCRSPNSKFVLALPGGVEREIFFSGEQDYTPHIPVRFNTFPTPVMQATNVGTTTCALFSPSNASATTYNTLAPVLDCAINPISSKPEILAQASYNNTNQTYNFDETATYYGTIGYIDPSPATVNLIMLPPHARDQLNVMNLISESVGNTSLKESFKYQGNYNGGDDDHSYGSLSQIRNMFSPDGPSSLFDHNATCAGLTGVKSISITEDGVTNYYEVEIKNVISGYPNYATDSLLNRPLSYCNDSNPLATSCDTSVSANYGKYEKSMLIKKNGVLREIMHFDCGSKSGRYEGIHAELEDGKYRREKNIFYWNTQDSAYARFEKYSRDLEATASTFALANLLRDSRKIERIYRDNSTSKIGGRVMNYSLERDSNGVLNKDLRYLNFMVEDISGWQFAYGFYDIHEPYTTDVFTNTGKFSSIYADTLDSIQFCGSWNYPMIFNTNCSSKTYVSEPDPILNLTSNSYQDVKPASFDTEMSSGYFPIAW